MQMLNKLLKTFELEGTVDDAPTFNIIDNINESSYTYLQ